MKHIHKVSIIRADAFTDFMNAIFRAWSDYTFAKKNGF